MTNTQQRFISAFIIILTLFAFAAMGPKGVMVFIFLVGVLFVDEFLVNFIKLPRKHYNYLISMVSFSAIYIYFNFIDASLGYFRALNNLALVLHTILLGYLFIEKMKSKTLLKTLKHISPLIGAMIAVSFLSLTQLLHSKVWLTLTLMLLIFIIAVDTGAWFFGRKFGKRKLWPVISPKKTIIGSLGGIAVATILTSLISIYAFGKISTELVLAFILLSALAQLGDLIESKLKRQIGIKDSSRLIPGHGGIFDRIDSIYFVSPYFVFVYHYFY